MSARSFLADVRTCLEFDRRAMEMSDIARGRLSPGGVGVRLLCVLLLAWTAVRWLLGGEAFGWGESFLWGWLAYPAGRALIRLVLPIPDSTLERFLMPSAASMLGARLWRRLPMLGVLGLALAVFTLRGTPPWSGTPVPWLLLGGVALAPVAAICVATRVRALGDLKQSVPGRHVAASFALVLLFIGVCILFARLNGPLFILLALVALGWSMLLLHRPAVRALLRRPSTFVSRFAANLLLFAMTASWVVMLLVALGAGAQGPSRGRLAKLVPMGAPFIALTASLIAYSLFLAQRDAARLPSKGSLISDQASVRTFPTSSKEMSLPGKTRRPAHGGGLGVAARRLWWMRRRGVLGRLQAAFEGVLIVFMGGALFFVGASIAWFYGITPGKFGGWMYLLAVIWAWRVSPTPHSLFPGEHLWIRGWSPPAIWRANFRSNLVFPGVPLLLGGLTFAVLGWWPQKGGSAILGIGMVLVFAYLRAGLPGIFGEVRPFRTLGLGVIAMGLAALVPLAYLGHFLAAIMVGLSVYLGLETRKAFLKEGPEA